MSDAVMQEISFQGLRTLFLLALPVIVVVSLAGVLIGSLQAATTIRDEASAYGIKLIAVVVLLYVMMPAFSRSLLSLARIAISGN